MYRDKKWNFQTKNPWKLKNFWGSLPATSGSKGITEIKWKEREVALSKVYISGYADNLRILTATNLYLSSSFYNKNQSFISLSDKWTFKSF